MNLVPTASTTAALALGDALAMTVLVEKGFRPEDFANLHPGGKLGKRLMRVEQLMASGKALPVVQLHTSMRDVIHEISNKKLGMTTVVEKDGRLAGIITDGDLRRKMGTTANIQELTARDLLLDGLDHQRRGVAASAGHALRRRTQRPAPAAPDRGRDASQRLLPGLARRREI